ncbi:MAG: HAMP domain-containing protein [Candidatus Competibacteraceae bacterium]|nr:MAG: HAMP domain-containing protein [Candidatus Competibacteraceae bacterium]
MRNLKIGTRLFLLLLVPLVILLIIGIDAYIGLVAANKVFTKIDKELSEINFFTSLSATVRTDLQEVANGVSYGTISWEEADRRLVSAKPEFERIWNGYLATAEEARKEITQDTFGPEVANITQAFEELQSLVKGRDHARLTLYLENELSGLTVSFFDALQALTLTTQQEAQEGLENTAQANDRFLTLLTILGIAGILFSGLLGFYIYRSISTTLQRLTGTVQGVTAGDFTIRSAVTGSDELATLGQAFDRLLDERLAVLVQTEKENETLNDSIINLLQAVSLISQRDLTVHVPVTEDMTGPVADALNLLTSETVTVLKGVTRISEEVATASDKVKTQSDAVIVVAENERLAVDQTAVDLIAASETMQQIAQLAQECSATAETTIKTTQAALQAVTSTVSGINSTRDTIRETEKRIKRLGERSQEISGVVNLINTIAERTHILALNASMHAASAGEAGRGFAVVADEVQRLAQNAREATSQIATLVSNIQIETADTVNAMNTAISQVVDGSRLAEQAGEQMQLTQETTTELVTAVQQIASRSQEQARISNELLGRAEQIQASTQQTSQQLLEQTVQTTNLVEYAKNLLNSVRVFRLPA